MTSYGFFYPTNVFQHGMLRSAFFVIVENWPLGHPSSPTWFSFSNFSSLSGSRSDSLLAAAFATSSLIASVRGTSARGAIYNTVNLNHRTRVNWLTTRRLSHGLAFATPADLSIMIIVIKNKKQQLKILI